MKFVNAEYYSADWCQPCKSFKPIFKDAMADQGIAFREMDVEANPDEAKANGIMSMPTVIFWGWTDDTDRGMIGEVGRIVGASRKQLTETLDKLAKEGYNGQQGQQ